MNELKNYCLNNTDLEIQDIFKYLYQSCLGCEHLISDSDFALQRIKAEMKDALLDDLPEIEMLDGDFCRVHLKILSNSFSAEDLCRLFLESAKTQPDGEKRLELSLAALIDLSEANEIPFSADEIRRGISEWKQAGYPTIHHSERFRNTHHPAYRVVRKDLINK